MCRGCNAVLCTSCFPTHVHRVLVTERCRNCGGAGVLPKATPKDQNLWHKFLARPDFPPVIQQCSSCAGRGSVEL
jgi:hypothetical protein